MAVNRNNGEYNFGSYSSGQSQQQSTGASGQSSNAQNEQDFQQVQRQQEEQQKNEDAEKDNASSDSDSKSENSENKESKDSKDSKDSEKSSDKNSEGPSEKESSSDKNGESRQTGESEGGPAKKQKIENKSSKGKEDAGKESASGSDEGASIKSKGNDQQKGAKDNLKKAAVGAKVAGGAAKVGAAAMTVNAVRSIIQAIFAFIKGIIQAVTGFFASVATTVVGFFTGAASAIAGAFAISTTIASIVLAGILFLVPATAAVAAYNYVQDTNNRRVESNCIGEGYDNASDAISIEAQGKAVAAYAERVASEEKYPYARASKVTGDESSLKGGYVCDQFVSHCFLHEQSEMITDFVPVTEWYLDYDKYIIGTNHPDDITIKLDMLKPGDVLCFDEDLKGTSRTKDGNRPCGHVAIYIGDGRIAHAMDPDHGILCTNLELNEDTGDTYSKKKLARVIRPYEPKGTEFSDGESAGSVELTGTHKEFVEEIAKWARKYWEPYHIYPSTIIAQAINESSWGTSTIAKKKHNYYGLGAYDSSPYASAKSHDAAAGEKFPGSEGSTLAAIKNYWTGAHAEYAEVEYWDVISSHNWKDQVMNVGKSSWASGGYRGTGKYSYKGGDLVQLIEQNGLDKYNEGLSDFEPDKSKYGGKMTIADASSAETNSKLSSLNADDGCGGKKKDNTDKWSGAPGEMASDENATWLAYDEDALESKIGKQGDSQCGTYACAYASFIMSGGKWHTSLKGFHSYYPEYGINTHTASSAERRMDAIWDEVVENKRPVVVAGQGSGTGGFSNHYTTVIGVRKGVTKETVKPTDWVVLDPYQSDAKSRRNFYGSHDWMKGYNFNGSTYGLQYSTCESFMSKCKNYF